MWCVVAIRCSRRGGGLGSIRRWLTAVDVFHLQKEGNNVRMRGISRVVPERMQDDEYSARAGGRLLEPSFSTTANRQYSGG